MLKKIVFAGLLLSGSFMLSAQDFHIVGAANGKGIHQKFLTNEIYDNLYIGAGAGISTRFTVGSSSDIVKSFVNPSVNVIVMKWVTPRVGIRLGYLGFNGREGLSGYNPYQINHSPLPYKPDGSDSYADCSSLPGTLYYGSMQLHGDVVWNILNTFGGYKRERFYTVSLYGSAGYLKLYDNKNAGQGLFSKRMDREFVVGAGFLNTFRFGHRLVGTADLRLSNHASRYRTKSGVWTMSPSLNLGVMYNLYRTNWTEATAVKATVDEAVAAQEEAEKKVEEIKLKNVDLTAKIEKLTIELGELKADTTEVVKVNAVEYIELKKRAENADLVVYFYINQSKLNFSEIFRLDQFVTETLAKKPDYVFNITGSADKGTGNMTINERLSHDRAMVVKDYLIRKYGVKPSNIVTSSVVTDKHLDGAYDRCAIIEGTEK